MSESRMDTDCTDDTEGEMRKARCCITAIVPAAGASRRMGRPKPLLPWGATTVLGQTLENLRRSRARDILVITGDHGEAVARIATACGARAVHNPDWASGLIGSLQAGVRAVGPSCRAVLVLLADQPMIGPDLIDAVVAAYLGSGQARSDEVRGGVILAAAFRGQRGHPVLIGRQHFAELLDLPASGAPRDLLVRHADTLRLVETGSERVLGDLDTPEAYARWRSMIQPLA